MRPTISALTALCAAAAALRVPPPRMMAAAGELLRIRHRVDDVSTTAAFYTQALGFESSDSPGGEKGGVVLRGAGGGLGLELVSAAGAGFQPDAGYQGLSVRVPSVDAALAASTECGGVVLMEPTIVEHGPSMTPDEPESQMNNMTEAVVADPSGFPLLLHECADADAACLSGARLSVFEWKKSQEWYESIGWNMQRFNSNVHREASLTISMGAQPADPPIGPRGALPPASEPVIQIYYKYSCKKIKQPADGSLASLVLAAADGESAELTDPDGYTVLLSNE